MASAAEDDGAPITAINVTPFVDIILVVLVIFMATAPLISKRVLKVDVPKAAHHEKSATEALQITLDSKKEIHLAGQKIGEDDLKLRLSKMTQKDPDMRVTLSADKTIPYGEVVSFLDVLRGSGVRKLGLEVVRK
jgi:biopolymer transport protein ExbD